MPAAAVSRSPRDRPPLSRVLVGWVAVGVLALAATLGTNLFRPLGRAMVVSHEIAQTRREYWQGERDLQALETELRFLETDAGKRAAAWRQLGLVEPGWEVGRTVEPRLTPPPPLSTRDRYHRWWVGWQERWEARLDRVGEALRIYSRRGPLDLETGGRNPVGPDMSKDMRGTPAASPATDP